MMRYIKVTTQFEGVHCWPEAPEEVAYLRNPHRHVFHVEAIISVTHDDRELEFIMVKHRIDEFIRNLKAETRVSCEQYAIAIAKFLEQQYGIQRTYTVEVNEDGENGAIVSLGSV